MTRYGTDDTVDIEPVRILVVSNGAVGFIAKSSVFSDLITCCSPDVQALLNRTSGPLVPGRDI